MAAHAIDIALPIFRVAFPGCQALCAFDNATNHCAYKSDALLVSSMNLNSGGQQPHVRETFVPPLGRTQLMTWPEDVSVPFQLRGVPKGLKQILT